MFFGLCGETSIPAFQIGGSCIGDGNGDGIDDGCFCEPVIRPDPDDDEDEDEDEDEDSDAVT